MSLYYTAPTDEIFDEVKAASIALWSTMGDEPSYAQGKIARVSDVKNVSGGLMYIVAMFDIGNQSIISSKISDEACHQIRMRMLSGGAEERYIVF